MLGDPRRHACAARRHRSRAIHFRRAVGSQTVPGPRDWDHFNEAGYRVLGKLLADRINNNAADR
jgi:lysophospholipase L1-like esterase